MEAVTGRFWRTDSALSTLIPRARAREAHVHGHFLRLDHFLLQKCAIQRNAARITLLRLAPGNRLRNVAENCAKSR